MSNPIIIIPDHGYVTKPYQNAARLHFKLNNCPILISGRTRNPEKMGSYGLKKYLEQFGEPIPITSQIETLISKGIKEDDIFHEDCSTNTKENAICSLNIIRDQFPETDTIHLCTTFPFNRRTYLTFLKTLHEQDLNIKLKTNQSIQPFPLGQFIGRTLLAPFEYGKIRKYRAKGHL